MGILCTVFTTGRKRDGTKKHAKVGQKLRVGVFACYHYDCADKHGGLEEGAISAHVDDRERGRRFYCLFLCFYRKKRTIRPRSREEAGGGLIGWLGSLLQKSTTRAIYRKAVFHYILIEWF